jgi:transposase
MSEATPIARLDQIAPELRSFATKCGDGAQVRRLLALAVLMLDGRSHKEAAEQNGMDRQTLSDWVRRCNAAGIDGLKSCHPPGAAPLLSDAQKAELVVKGPDPEKDKVIR